jgi:hypothetical protein
MARKKKVPRITHLSAADKATLRRIMKKVRAIKISKLRRSSSK